MKPNRRTGFTLIELLVVIAIIAILAAILFPVFAQAREQARKTSCLSNAKEWGTAQAMYTQDYDELYVTAWNYGAPTLRDNGSVYRSYQNWTLLVQPYVKNKQLGVCPDMTSIGFVQSGNNRSLLYSGYGMNYGYLGIYNGTLSQQLGYDVFVPISLGAVAKPAQVVLLMDMQGVDWATADHQFVWTEIGNCVDPPDSFTSANVFFGNGWGGPVSGCGDYTTYYDYPGYGGADFRHSGGGFIPGQVPSGGANVVFCDYHAKFYKVGGLTAGTNYSPTQSCTQTQVTNPSFYLWNPNYN